MRDFTGERMAYFLLSKCGAHGLTPFLFFRQVALTSVCVAFLSIPCYAETWIATAYCPCIKCCGKTDGITASGKKAVEGRSVAVNWLKFGQKVALNGRSYIVEDRGAKSEFGSFKRHLRRIDVFFAHHKDALRFGRQKVDVRIKPEGITNVKNSKIEKL